MPESGARSVGPGGGGVERVAEKWGGGEHGHGGMSSRTTGHAGTGAALKVTNTRRSIRAII